MYRERCLWTTSTLGEAFSFVQALSCCSCLPASGNSLRKSVVNSLSFTGNKSPHSWVLLAWAFPFWPSWLSASIWVPVILHVFICKLQFWPTIPSGCLTSRVCRAERSKLCQEQPFRRWLSKAQQNIRICMRACFLLHPYQVQFLSLLNQGIRAIPLFVHCYKKHPSFSRSVFVLRWDQVQLCVCKG